MAKTERQRETNWGLGNLSFSVRVTIYCLILGLVYTAAGIFRSYGYYDDFWQLYEYQHGNYPWLTSPFYQLGRPVQDLVSRPLFTGMNSLEGLKWIRAMNLGLLMVFGIHLLYMLEAIGRFRNSGLIITLVATLTPAAGIYVAWAGLIHAPLALVLSGMSGWICFRILGSGSMGISERALCWGAVILGALLAESSYQPAAGAFLLPFLIDIAANPGKREANLRAAMGLGCFVLILIAYFLLYKLSIYLWIREGWWVGREDLGIGLIGQILHFISHFSILVASFWEFFLVARPQDNWAVKLDLILNPLMAVLVLFITYYTWLRPVLSNPRDRNSWLTTGLFIALFGVMMAPVVATHERHMNFRLFFLCYLTFAFFVFTGAERLVHARPGCRKLMVGFFVFIAGLFCFQTWFHIRKEIVTPSIVQMEMIRSLTVEKWEAYPTAIAYVAPPHSALIEPMVRTPLGEYGIPLASLEWGPIYLIRLVLNKSLTGQLQFAASEDVPVLHIPSTKFVESQWIPALRGDRLFMEEALPPRTFENLASDHPQWGPVIEYKSGWMYSPDYGYFNLGIAPWMQQSLIGWIYFNEEYNIFEMKHPQLGHVYAINPDIRNWYSGDGQHYRVSMAKGRVEWTKISSEK